MKSALESKVATLTALTVIIFGAGMAFIFPPALDYFTKYNVRFLCFFMCIFIFLR